MNSEERFLDFIKDDLLLEDEDFESQVDNYIQLSSCFHSLGENMEEDCSHCKLQRRRLGPRSFQTNVLRLNVSYPL
jgi:hypothetical protein